MAGAGTKGDSTTSIFGSTETALCIIPPRQYWSSVDKLRMLYDKAYEKWPPHVNLIYPFVETGNLSEAAKSISSHFQKNQSTHSCEPELRISLDTAGYFQHRRENTIFIHDNDAEHTSRLEYFRSSILEAMGQLTDKYQMHMTIGQSEDLDAAPHKFLLQKVGLVPPIQWDVEELCILVRERTQQNGLATSRMNLWGTISLKDFTLHQLPAPFRFYDVRPPAMCSELKDTKTWAEKRSLTQRPFHFSTKTKAWQEYHFSSTDGGSITPDKLDEFKVSSYNVLAEFEYPPSQTRYSGIISNLLGSAAKADVLVLQEVTDDFLCYLLRDDNIRNDYPFVTNGPPDQSNVGPLPSHLNVVVLSKWFFTWQWVQFNRRHKGSVVLEFSDIGRRDGEEFVPAILAAVHLTCGLTDGSVAAKKTELQAVLNHLSDTYPHNPTVLAGDFNLTTSAYTVRAALEKRAVSKQTVNYLTNLEELLAESGFSDTWTTARLENVETSQPKRFQWHSEIFEGEEGATFDPMHNPLAAAIVGGGFNNRPQRYDRVLLKSGSLFSVAGFNMFGQDPINIEEGHDVPVAGSETYASDHWGIRSFLKIITGSATDSSESEASRFMAPVVLNTVSESLADVSELRQSLVERRVFPSLADIDQREEALKVLKAALSDANTNGETSEGRSGVQFVLVPVGSYGLDVWTTASDLDCLCIGSTSPRTFFSLATQRLRKASAKGIKVLRKVNALSGTMLELEVMEIKVDLQYCPSATIAQTWPKAMGLPANSPAFILPAQTLAKLKPARDLHYLRRTITDFASFRIAFYLIKTWAKQRGIYSARFGYLGGIHIAVLLSRVCKLLSREHGAVSIPAIVSTFFNHYANVDWATQIIFDPFFHKQLRYVRTSREPMVILGFHSPSLNVATAASTPSVRAISDEFKKADCLLSREDVSWKSFLGNEPTQCDDGPNTFLGAYKSYVKISVQFWGVSLAKGSQFVGWLESRCVRLLVDIGRRAPNLHARIWPARFVAGDSSEDETDYQGCYLIGLGLPDINDKQAISKEDLRIMHGSLLTSLQRFEEQIRGDEKFFDAKYSWMSASIVKQSELEDLKLDNRNWGEYTIGEDESEDEEDDEDMIVDDADGEFAKARTKKTKKHEKEAPLKFAYSGKFRSSTDVINRIRWDHEMDSSDYLVGYEDRFLGIKERLLDQWKAEQTDEEFIPQHRIMYFKRVSDGVIVWDRRLRTDDIFGSGVARIEA